MGWVARRALSMSQQIRILSVAAIAVAGACGGLLLNPANVGAAALIRGSRPQPPRSQPMATLTREVPGGAAAVGALFTVSDGQLDSHFCTANVVDSTHGDLVVTAAHCLTGIEGQIVFVPGYANGKTPYGIWPVTAIYTSQSWQSSQDPDDDIAFLRLADSSGGVPIEHVTGAEQLGTDWPVPTVVQVTGYPDETDQPISCMNSAKSFSPTQLEFDCDGYTDGTSGSALLADVSAASGYGTIIGVIGGYEQGGDTADVSYAAAFGSAAEALFHSAEAGG
jgi:V8-like Glu-specific endopeptidase